MSIELSPEILNSVSLYPNIDDNKFNLKISNKEEFSKTKKGEAKFDNIEEYSNNMACEFTELLPHQVFVKNFLSIFTPYNSLLLFHGLGTGKTCSSIGISETMRVYLKNLGIVKKILIVATPNIQDNFKKQLFDENKLKETNGVWNLKSCVGNNLLNEIKVNKYSSKKTIIAQINKIIEDGYEFIGYTKLSHLIEQKKAEKKLNSYFDNRLIIIDEVHNIRVSEDSESKKIASNLFYLVKNISTLKLLLLSATPMFNSYKEIIWITNLMNLNDGRPIIEEKEIFDKEGDFLIDENGEEVGKKKFIRKITGYVSFVRGENPFTFPYRIFPYQFDNNRSFLNESIVYPRIQFNNDSIIQHLEHVDVYNIGVGSYQKIIYEKIISGLLNKNKDDEEGNKVEKLGYNKMQVPLEALNIVFPIQDIEEEIEDETINSFVGKDGLSKIVKNVDKFPYVYEDKYLNETNKKSIFAPDNIQQYSEKINSIVESILNNEGITLVYSQYLYGGLLPLALALEEVGFKRFTKKTTLLSSDYISKHRIIPKKTINGKQLTYAMITGATTSISSQNSIEIKNTASEENKDGDIIKVVLISRAGSEGIDLKNIRSIHIMEPWYNMNRIEQIIGRGVRNCSHRLLPYKKRNVLIYLYGTSYENKSNELVEGIDLYLYRISEIKAIKIGAVTRILKETAVDCLLSSEYNDLSIDKLDTKTEQLFANQKQISIDIGDKPFSAICDYMESCSYNCISLNDSDNDITNINFDDDDDSANKDTLDEFHVLNNINQLVFNIKILFKEKHFYYYEEIINKLTHFNKYPESDIKAALNILTSNHNEELLDMFERVGYITNHGDIYFFQPKEITSKNISLLERSTPVDYKYSKLELTKEISESPEPQVENDIPKLDTVFDQDIEEKKEIKQDTDILAEFSNLVEIFKKSRPYTVIYEIIKKSTITNKTVFFNFLDNIVCNIIVFDQLSFDKRFNILQLIDNDEIDAKLSVIKNYIYQYIFEYDDEKYLLFAKEEELLLLEKNKDKWVEASSFMKKETKDTIKSKYNIDISGHGDSLGVGIYKIKSKKEEFIFKIKDTHKTRATGVVCNVMYKNDLVELVSSIFNEYTFIKEMRDSQTIHICLLVQILFRFYHHINKDNKVWFLSPTLTNIYKKYIHTIKL
uniref:Helicase ATP-binding domain-containing protein n=1 Tax=viral metagenome TaxID=1070528 RepID=A0A6C0AXD1_9ZZZZ|tara:strand:- start:187 stop:3654 length:3468 start_codon:yes stop_codon:yes gene_type:complete